MNMRIIITAVILLPGLLSAFAQDRNNTRLEPEEFAIMPWGWTPGDLSTFKDIYDCGFNLAGFVRIEDLKNVSRAGLKAIVYENSIQVGDAEAELGNAEISKRVNDVARKTSGNPAVYGYYLRDEPGTSAFGGLKRWKDAWALAAPGKVSYINLFPNYANNSEQLKANDYDDYVERYIETVKPSFISYDNYSLMKDGTLRKGYFENLATIRDAALKNNIPFWNIVLSNAHFDYMDPSYEGLCFHLYTTLAYGARGISYFTYFAPKHGNYRYAPVDQFGNKTPVWYILQNINLQMHAMGKVYVKLKSVNVFHFPKSEECANGLESSLFLASLRGDDLVVGEFEGEDKIPHIIVVNKSLTKSHNITLSFREQGKVYQINNYTGNPEPFSGESTWLAPGQGRILFLKK